MAERYQACLDCGVVCRGLRCKRCRPLYASGPNHPLWKGEERLTRHELYLRHAEKNRAYSREWYWKNRDRAQEAKRAYARQYYADNPRNPTWVSWTAMLYRCTVSKNNPRWKDYGGRGIAICERWMTFANFLADMGERPAGKTLDRIDNDGNYEPGNCRWATPREQAANRRR